MLGRLYERDRTPRYGIQPRPASAFAGEAEWFARAVSPPARVIECGAGTGTFAALLAERGYDVVAADRYGDADLETVRRQHAGRPRLAFSLLDSALEPETPYDAAVSINVLEHVLGPDEILARWRACLRPGGTLSLICPNYTGAATPLRIAAEAREGRRPWRYASRRNALGHALENVLLDWSLILRPRPCFVRCMPAEKDGEVDMFDADADTVHLPSARGLRIWFERNGFEILTWRQGGRTPLRKAVQAVFPGLGPTVRIHARKRGGDAPPATPKSPNA